jgi:biotin carboxylase
MNGLMVAFGFTLPYHVMRVASAAGIRVHVLGAAASRGLRTSRCCRVYRETRCGGDAETLLAEIAEMVNRHGIDVVLPSDDVSTRLLAGLVDRLPVRCMPLPEAATFDLLNDKWNFTRFCLENGVRAPEARLFDTVAGLRAALDTGELGLPLTVKPINRSGGVGVLHIREPADQALLDAVDYHPVLAQRHVRGESVSITLLCDHGRVRAQVAQQRDPARFRVITDADLLDNATRLVSLTGYHGVANFDAVLSAEDGLAYLVECNPRLWYSIYLVMLAGLNFVALALAPPGAFAEPATLSSGDIRLSLSGILAKPWRTNPLDRANVSYCLSDPVAFGLQRAKMYDDSAVAVPVAQMSERGPAGYPATA